MSGDPTQPEEDVVVIHGKTEDGKGLEVLRFRQNRLEAGAVRPLEEGKPIRGDLVKLKPRPNMPLVCDVEVQLPAPEASPTGSRHNAPKRPATPPAQVSNVDSPSEARKGPARVATAAYRKNWDTIWKRSKKPSLLN